MLIDTSGAAIWFHTECPMEEAREPKRLYTLFASTPEVLVEEREVYVGGWK